MSGLAPWLIRSLTQDDVAVFQPLRLEALRLHPEAFGASVEEELMEGSGRMIGAHPSLTLGAFADGVLIGSAGLQVPVRVKQRHRGNLFGIFVTPAWRGRGVGRAMLEGLLAHARDAGLRHVTLSVTSGNAAARALYRHSGFLTIGVEPDSLVIDGTAYDEERMALRLTGYVTGATANPH
ncbi:MAG: GNAT family N-acetyltransferase [Acetobacteraceae bacterium]|nr:GNAT family N-acetyltransferase [Pseudomonadota bacterium]